VLQAALDEIDAEVTKADEVLKTAGERTTLLVEQKLAALACSSGAVDAIGRSSQRSPSSRTRARMGIVARADRLTLGAGGLSRLARSTPCGGHGDTTAGGGCADALRRRAASARRPIGSSARAWPGVAGRRVAHRACATHTHHVRLARRPKAPRNRP
jgi:hypothetical protein